MNYGLAVTVFMVTVAMSTFAQTKTMQIAGVARKADALRSRPVCSIGLTLTTNRAACTWLWLTETTNHSRAGW